MKRLSLALVLFGVAMAGPFAASVSADPAIHEIVAAYCSGGSVGVINSSGFLEPPGITGGSNADNFAMPVIASGAVDPFPFISSQPNAKWPQGTFIFGGLTEAANNHPSAQHCPGASVLP